MNELRHVAFIMDGNSSWAIANNRQMMEGYLAGMRKVSEVVSDAIDFGIEYLTFYVFSSENWRRSEKWVSDFMSLSTRFLKTDESIAKIIEAGAKLKVIGNRTKLNSELREIISDFENRTKNNDRIIIQLGISYGGRDEIIRAAKKMVEKRIEFTEENLSNNLDTAFVPDPELIVRTSGKQRLSNFLLWQASYSEFYFSSLLWPDFSKVEFQKAIDELRRRKRTYGK
ncbi:MAG: di-trans,poly-cis-decaprenylcistransferase [Holosporales bacterium]|jgi:undecaprenyl diphosphate synthase|nr:di-trans,poly-cis-decaprenylcistransferase [Holosporales bacterium]